MKKFSLAVVLAGLCLVGGECFGKAKQNGPIEIINYGGFRLQGKGCALLKELPPKVTKCIANGSRKTDECPKCCLGIPAGLPSPRPTQGGSPVECTLEGKQDKLSPQKFCQLLCEKNPNTYFGQPR